MITGWPLPPIENGADKIRINPGNIGDQDRVRAVVDAARERNIPIRVGVNGGSLEKELLEKYHGVTPEGLVESALAQAALIEDMGYENLVISIKSSDVLMCARAHELIAAKTDHPLHVGITEAGTPVFRKYQVCCGIGNHSVPGHRGYHPGIPDGSAFGGSKVRQADSEDAWDCAKGAWRVVSCPTCGRTQIDLIGLANQVETLVQDIPLDLKVAVMGCVVNGPGEAREADIGIAGGKGEGLLIKKGEIVKKVPESELLACLREELLNWNP